MGFTPDLTDHLWDKRSPLSPGLFSLAEPNTPEGTGRGWLPAGVGGGPGCYNGFWCVSPSLSELHSLLL